MLFVITADLKLIIFMFVCFYLLYECCPGLLIFFGGEGCDKLFHGLISLIFQVLVFSNMSSFLSRDEWVSSVIEIVESAIRDDRVEIRVKVSIL
jgi:hypothetical protein